MNGSWGFPTTTWTNGEAMNQYSSSTWQLPVGGTKISIASGPRWQWVSVSGQWATTSSYNPWSPLHNNLTHHHTFNLLRLRCECFVVAKIDNEWMNNFKIFNFYKLFYLLNRETIKWYFYVFKILGIFTFLFNAYFIK